MLHKLDQALFLVLNKWNHPAMDLFFTLKTSTFFWAPLYILLLFFIRKALAWKGVMLFILTIVISDQCSATWLKPLFARYRPCYAMDEIHLVGTYKGIYGFPSAHASNTYAFAMLFWRIFKAKYKFSGLFFMWATIVSYGRIYGGVHYPLDVFSGAILGCCIGLLMDQAYQKIRSHNNTS
ncbi:MAG: phosphatase PAP2 family protein [Candidatus Cardinium sp.]|uniref:phosphatase PAP2 family protein n=1 Tax=Cardinium endosymbiont of Dermatophagoides farinae TaxID=2597823 RepID=UPI001181ED14|nr:phosphatase PAP2 family protein [Cardinium endosymbiont of Dermatophagoides farinae]TSJ81369.1 phosphatase PAP2 family protein [Cardinium endosymbiont of Dermatophagoides farinae]UWW97434.1 MAG: phosphatase PAP2 family protein [Candidatus Cardinium sp.]